jgi:hypothetical protein
MAKRRKRAVRQVVVRCDLRHLMDAAADHAKRLPAVETRVANLERCIAELCEKLGKPEIVERHVGEVLPF